MQQAIALNRFGLGARPGEAPPNNPQAWLIDQFDRFETRPHALAAVPDYAQSTALVKQVRDEQRASRGMGDAAVAKARALNRGIGDLLRQHIKARVVSAIQTDTPFVERLVHFWANHFAVSTESGVISGAGPFEFEAIRPHVLGRFGDMLTAVETHPVMLAYLDQTVSVGPNSPLGKRFANRRTGLNENLAREIMELHTLGVRSGYTQADVTEFARALTGWTTVGTGPGAQLDGEFGSTRFLPDIHEPGDRQVFGRRFAAGGKEQSLAILADFAGRPETAKHLATKLACHFVSDDPPAPLVARLEKAYLTSGGDLPTVYRALIASPEAWAQPFGKFKSPWDWTISTWRAVGAPPELVDNTQLIVQRLGQPVWQPGSPAGWPDMAQNWASSDELMRRYDIANRITGQVSAPSSVAALAGTLLPGVVQARTSDVIRRAPAEKQLALLLIAPEFQRR